MISLVEIEEIERLRLKECHSRWRIEVFKWENSEASISSSNEFLQKKRKDTKKQLEEQLDVLSDNCVQIRLELALELAAHKPELAQLLAEFCHAHDKWSYYRSAANLPSAQELVLREAANNKNSISKMPSISVVVPTHDGTRVEAKEYWKYGDLDKMRKYFLEGEMRAILQKMKERFQ